MNARSPRWIAIAVAGVLLVGCGYNSLQRQDENVKAAWSEVVNQYQRRAELVASLVKTVAGFARQPQLLNGVAEARATVSSIPASVDVLNSPQAFARYQAAQNQLTQSIARLLAVSDGYPELRSSGSFRDLRAQLQRRESRIALARAAYVEAVHQYNSKVGVFPASVTAKMLDLHARPTLTAAEGLAVPTAPVSDSGGARPTGGLSGGATARTVRPAQPEPEPAMPRSNAKPAPAE